MPQKQGGEFSQEPVSVRALRACSVGSSAARTVHSPAGQERVPDGRRPWMRKSSTYSWTQREVE